MSYLFRTVLNSADLTASQAAQNAALAAGSGAALVGVQQAGAGAVARLLRDKLRERVAVADFGTLATALAEVAAGTLIVSANIQMLAAATVPAGLVMRVENGAVIDLNGFTLTINGRFEAPPVQCFSTGTGAVVFAKASTPAVWPQWWGAKGDASADASSGTDCTAAFSKAITASTLSGGGVVAILPIRTGPGNFLMGNVVLPPATDIRGEGRHVTNFVCKLGTVGKWWTDNGSASKVVLADFAMYAAGVAVTHGLQLGRNGVEHGTEGYLRELWIRDCNAVGAIGLDVNSNVGFYSTITVQACSKCIVIGGSPSHLRALAVMQPTEVGADLSYCTVEGLHIEAPGNACVPLKLTRNTYIRGLSIALANGTTISHLTELNAATTSWSINGLDLFFNTLPGSVTVSGGNFKRADGTFFGGNGTAGNLGGIGSYSSETAGQKMQAFTLRVTNTAGVLQHRISTVTGNLSNFASRINGASATLVTTPTGSDAVTAMLSGGKIGSASPSVFHFDTANQKDADGLFMGGDVWTSAGVALVSIASMQSVNINGVSRLRLALQFFNAATGAAYDLTTANIGVGTTVQCNFLGYLT